MSQTETRVRADAVEQPEDDAPVKKQKSRRPANTAFRQQRLKAWQPILTPKTVLPLFFAIGIIFAPIGALLLYASSQVQELIIDYSECGTTAKDSFSDMPSDKYSAHFRTQSTSGSPASYPAPQWKTELKDQSWPWGVTKPKSPHCTLQFTVPNDLAAPVLLYYRLTNFYQNHRRYVKSFDDDQLAGKAVPNATIQTSPCDPLRLSSEGKAYYPCGLIANSVFNDTFDSPVMMMGSGSSSSSSSNTTTIYPMTANDIAWPSDQALFKKTSYTADQIAPPPNWHERYPQGYTPANLPDLSQLQSLQVWMRTAGLPTFSKLALRNDDPSTPMRAGTYRLAIFDNFPATKYGGTKSVVLSTRTVMGGRNAFLGIAYVVVGALLLCLGVLFTLAHLVRPRKLGDHSYLTWSQERVGGGAGAGAGTGTGAGSGGENGATTTTGAQR